MKLAQAEAILRRITYKAGWKLSLRDDFYLDMVSLCISSMEQDATRKVPGEIEVLSRDAIPLERLETERELLQWVRRALQAREMHELDEWLQIGGVAPFYPH